MFRGVPVATLAPGLIVADRAGWIPAAELTGPRLGTLLESAGRQWRAQPHAAAALAWKTYTYWLALPAVLGWASARRVPLITADNVLVQFDNPGVLLKLGLRPGTPVAVLPDDPLALGGHPDAVVVGDEAALLGEFRRAVLDQHLTPLLDALHTRVRLGSRPLLGSLASGIAYGILRSADTTPGRSAESIGLLLGALGIDDLIDLVPAPHGGLDVQRKTCCLAFTLPTPKLCPGCCIKP
ncbi:IucA/IucC family C-terminal-domain containing protein [Actinoplanes oblitus]|uniref:IucA/IucC family C-terminal-domain containing protein n=1 Tax=Actinoplanes oblitus TaxID=3040509 RepID=A0ABY8WST9_9ACTN|nr:IucA/IucC family C-terminal-domain containing protein [Actinoplanes oblitus]WIN01007.1 IucA/IucC family C-terminal-domain containing protein [Actinoplanes oblitus]